MVFEKIRAILSELLETDPDQIDEGSTLESLDIDSVDLLDLITEVEDEFDIEISDSDLMGFGTVGDVVAYIERIK